MEKPSHAPVFEVEPRTIVAVEHPMMVMNLDNGIKTFGNNRPFERIMDTEDPEDCIPLYLRFNDPMCVPILSQHTPTTNVLLKITVPKRTGRKRKRGSQDPFMEADPKVPTATGDVPTPYMDNLRSHSRLDDPAQILRSLKDNKESYIAEAIGEVSVTHRFRGASDFHHATSTSKFFPRFRDTAMTGRVEDLRKFRFDKSMGPHPNEEFMPAPIMTSHQMHFNWVWQQNMCLFEETDAKTGEKRLVNHSRPKGTNLAYIPKNVEKVPTVCAFDIGDEPQLRGLVKRIQAAMVNRPIWTRRALLNHLGNAPDVGMIRPAIQYVGYQFKGGPFRDAIIKYGVDPRTDKSFRKYQTFFFKIFETGDKPVGPQGIDGRYARVLNQTTAKPKPGKSSGHLFDGKTLTVDGKVWQACDITEPLLARLLETAPYAPYDANDGYFHNGSIAKIKAIMKTKLLAIRTQKILVDKDFERALAIPDIVPQKLSRQVSIPLPDVRLTNEEMEALRAKGKMSIIMNNGMRKKEGGSRARDRHKKFRDRMMNDPTLSAKRVRFSDRGVKYPRADTKSIQEAPEPTSGEGSQVDMERGNGDEMQVGNEANRDQDEEMGDDELDEGGGDGDGLSVLDDNTDDEDMETITDIEEDEISD